MQPHSKSRWDGFHLGLEAPSRPSTQVAPFGMPSPFIGYQSRQAGLRALRRQRHASGSKSTHSRLSAHSRHPAHCASSFLHAASLPPAQDPHHSLTRCTGDMESPSPPPPPAYLPRAPPGPPPPPPGPSPAIMLRARGSSTTPPPPPGPAAHRGRNINARRLPSPCGRICCGLVCVNVCTCTREMHTRMLCARVFTQVCVRVTSQYVYARLSWVCITLRSCG